MVGTTVYAAEGIVGLDIFDPAGRLRRSLDAGMRTPGRRTLTWDNRDDAGRRLPAGKYFVRMTAGTAIATKRGTLVK